VLSIDAKRLAIFSGWDLVIDLYLQYAGIIIVSAVGVFTRDYPCHANNNNAGVLHLSFHLRSRVMKEGL
jgi:hypothetical protein